MNKYLDSKGLQLYDEKIKKYSDDKNTALNTTVENHITDDTIHVTAEEKSGWSQPLFSEAAERNNIESGETISTIFGKIKKWFTDLKAVAFSGSYNDLTDTPDLDNKVDKIEGKELSSNDFTDNYKSQLDTFKMEVNEDGSVNLIYNNEV